MIRNKERRRIYHHNLSQREKALGPEKRNENRAGDSVRIGSW